jgi:serine/threonine-protein phosphatase PGAM5
VNTIRLVILSACLAALSLAPVARAADAPVPPKPRGVHFIYLVRHGVYDRDTVNTDDRVGSALNPLGHEQAKLLGERLAKLPVKLHALVSSDFTRARETADDMGQVLGMKAERDSLIHECTPTADRPDYMNNHTPEDIALCESNLQAAWAKYVTPTPDADTHDVLVCHGNVIRWMVAKALGMDSKAWTHFDIGNASLTILSVRPDGSVRLAMYSDVGHIPVEKQTWAGVGGGWRVRAPGMK